MGGLNPADLSRIAVDRMAADKLEHKIGTAGRKVIERGAALCPEPFDHGRRIDLGKIGNDETGVAAGCAPGDLLRFKQDDFLTELGRMQGG